MNYIKISIGIFLVLAASRFIPHPPNFTSLIALSFYVPLLFGRRYIIAIISAYLITDLLIGFHSVTLFTWGSIGLIGIMTKYFLNSKNKDILSSKLYYGIFFIIKFWRLVS